MGNRKSNKENPINEFINTFLSAEGIKKTTEQMGLGELNSSDSVDDIARNDMFKIAKSKKLY
jgi:hypothetical protein